MFSFLPGVPAIVALALICGRTGASGQAPEHGHALQSGQIQTPDRVRAQLAAIASDPDSTRRTGMIRSLASTLTAAGRLPAADSSVLFLYHGQARSVSVAGDFNGWDPNADTLAAVHGTPFFCLEKSFEQGARVEYKYVVDGNWILDPINRAMAAGGFGPNSEVSLPGYQPPGEIVRRPGVPQGTLDTLSVISPVLGRSHPVFVYLPARHPSENPRLPAVFVLDGGEYVSLATMPTILDNLIHSRRIPPIAAIFIDPRTDPRDPTTNKRMTDYALNPAFVEALVNDFCLPLSRRYGLADSAARRAIMGASLGGLTATYAALSRPDVFGLCGAQSPSYQWQGGAIFETALAVPHPATRFYIDTGTIRDALEHSRRMASLLTERGHAVRFQSAPEGHNWANWRARIDDLLEYLFAERPAEE